MTTDTVGFIASCTKLVTAIAILQLVEKGQTSLDDPEVVAKILPEIAALKILEGTAPNFTYRSPTKKITLRMLLDHSSGLSYAVSTDKLSVTTTP